MAFKFSTSEIGFGDTNPWADAYTYTPPETSTSNIHLSAETDLKFSTSEIALGSTPLAETYFTRWTGRTPQAASGSTNTRPLVCTHSDKSSTHETTFNTHPLTDADLKPASETLPNSNSIPSMVTRSHERATPFQKLLERISKRSYRNIQPVPFVLHEDQFRELTELTIRTSKDKYRLGFCTFHLRSTRDNGKSCLEFKAVPHLGLNARFLRITLNVRLIDLSANLIDIEHFEPGELEQPVTADVTDRTSKRIRGGANISQHPKLGVEASFSQSKSLATKSMICSMGNRFEGGIRWSALETVKSVIGVPTQYFKLWTSANLPIVAKITVFAQYKTKVKTSDFKAPHKDKYVKYYFSMN